MGLLTRLFKPKTETRAMVPLVPNEIGMFNIGGIADSGVTVNETVALTASAVYACITVISNAIAALPVHVLKRETGDKQPTHRVAQLLAGEPNEYQTAPAWRETMLLQLLLWGNCYSFIERDELARPIGLLPLRSDRTRAVRTPGGQLAYSTTLTSGSYDLSPADVFHLANISLDGITGLSPIQLARQNVGLSLALERFAAKFFGNNAHTGGVLTVPNLKTDGMKAFVKAFREQYGGPENSWKTAVLEAGMTYTPTQVDPEKSQALQQRVHQLREVARIYRCPLHKIGDLERATFSNIEFQAMEFVQDTLMPWVVKLEAEANRKLLLEREKPALEVKFNLDGLLRADTKSRYGAHAIALNAGFATVNEIRARENMPPVDGGDVLRTPLNMAPAAGNKQPEPEPDKTAARALIEDAARRVLTKEARALARAAKKFTGKPEELRAWADTFYAGHAGLVARTLAAPMQAAGITTTPDDYAKRHCETSTRTIVAGIDAGTDLADVADEFTDIRPHEVAAELTK